jgi:hypothetical protein
VRTFSPAVVAALAAQRNTWMQPFLTASSAIARALADGRLPADLVAGFPVDHGVYPRGLAEQIAVLAGLSWMDEDSDPAGVGRERRTDAEDVTIAVEALQALYGGDVGCDGEVWDFQYPEVELAPFGLQAADVRGAVHGCTLTEVAALIVAADEWALRSSAR